MLKLKRKDKDELIRISEAKKVVNISLVDELMKLQKLKVDALICEIE